MSRTLMVNIIIICITVTLCFNRFTRDKAPLFVDSQLDSDEFINK